MQNTNIRRDSRKSIYHKGTESIVSLCHCVTVSYGHRNVTFTEKLINIEMVGWLLTIPARDEEATKWSNEQCDNTELMKGEWLLKNVMYWSPTGQAHMWGKHRGTTVWKVETGKTDYS